MEFLVSIAIHFSLRDTIIKIKQCRYKVDGKFAVEEKKATTPIVKQALIAATDFPNPPAATVFDDENDIKVTDPPESSRDKNANCPPCVCQCPSFQCPDNFRAIKRLVRQKRGNCICHCLCDYRCA